MFVEWLLTRSNSHPGARHSQPEDSDYAPIVSSKHSSQSSVNSFHDDDVNAVPMTPTESTPNGFYLLSYIHLFIQNKYNARGMSVVILIGDRWMGQKGKEICAFSV